MQSPSMPKVGQFDMIDQSSLPPSSFNSGYSAVPMNNAAGTTTGQSKLVAQKTIRGQVETMDPDQDLMIQARLQAQLKYKTQLPQFKILM